MSMPAASNATPQLAPDAAAIRPMEDEKCCRVARRDARLRTRAMAAADVTAAVHGSTGLPGGLRALTRGPRHGLAVS